MENKVISKEYVKRNFVNKNELIEFINKKSFKDTYNFKCITVNNILEFLEEIND